MQKLFRPGTNIAVKTPSHEYDATLKFYRDILGLEERPTADGGIVAGSRFQFGDFLLWIDKVPALSQAEIWLEVVTSDIDAAARHLEAMGCQRRDEIEPLPEGLAGFWVSSPANIIHLVNQSVD